VSEKKKYIKYRPDEHEPWCVDVYDKEQIWDAYISEMDIGDKMIIEIVEMTEEEFKALPEFMGW